MKTSQPLLFLLIIFAPALLVSGCGWLNSDRLHADLVTRTRVLEQQRSQLRSEIKARKKEYADLKLELLQKSAEIDRLKALERHLRQEVIRNGPNLFLTKTKAEAVVLLAETESKIDELKHLTRSGQSSRTFAGSDQLLEKSRSELDHGNYSKACALTSQALEQIRSKQFDSMPKTKSAYGSTNSFVFPLSMRVTKMSNVRRQPGMTARIIRIVDKGTKVTALGYRGHWIKIILNDQRPGWIYYSLLTLLKS